MYVYEDLTLDEIETYKKLEHESFNFGVGMIENKTYHKQDEVQEEILKVLIWDDLLSGYTKREKLNLFKKDKSRAIRRRNNYRVSIKNKTSDKFKNYKDEWVIHQDIYGRGFFRDLKSKPDKFSFKRQIKMTDDKLNEYSLYHHYYGTYCYWGYHYREYNLFEDYHGDCLGHWKEYLAQIELEKEQDKRWNEEYELNKDWYDGHDDY